MRDSTFDDLEILCNELLAQIKTLRTASKYAEFIVRQKATEVARRLLVELIHPEELAAEQSVTLSEWACIRMYMKWKLFDRIPLEGSTSYKELAASIGAEEALVCRMGQMLVSTGKLLQPTPNHVAHSRLSPSYRTGDRNGAYFAFHCDDFQGVFASLPDYFEKYGPRLPVGQTNIPFCFASGVDGQMTQWEVLARAYDYSWVEEYAAANSERQLIVDVGGSYGHALRANIVKFPGISPTRCVVEDRPEMIPNIQKEHAQDPIMKDVRKIAMDFHKEQPVKGKKHPEISSARCRDANLLNIGALVYLVRRCTHNYDDAACISILKILADSLPDDEPRARILINEQIMTDPPHRWVAALDIMVMTWSSLQRSEQQFEKLANLAGLDVVKVHKAEGSGMGVVECKKSSPLQLSGGEVGL
ncbi:hypothetical protein AAE478_000347 [Parahypoxylon ruwenzoriense]